MKNQITLMLFFTAMFFTALNMAGQDILFTEDFDYTPGPLPSSWVIEADQPPGWSINESQISGGVAPELYLTYGFQVGLSRLISPVIDIDGYEELKVSYKQYLINYGGDWGEVIGMDVTFDGGTTWQALWEQPLWLLNIPQDTFTYYVSAAAGATEMQLAFRYDGNNNAINGWAIDDIVVEEAIETDLTVSEITGSTTPNAGEETFFSVEITNGGKTTQNTYDIKLMDEEDNELASVPGTPITFAEKVTFDIPWTPASGDVGEGVVYALVEVADDEDPSNDQSKNLLLNIQPQGTETVGIGNTADPYPLTHYIPYNFFALNNLAQTLYLAEDIGVADDPITGIQYIAQFDEDVEDIPIQIYMAETSLDNLEDGWADPASFTLVYDGLMDFQKGLHAHYIHLDEEFEYNGGNLVIYSNKSQPESMLVWSTFMSTYHESPIYSRNLEGDGSPYDALDPPAGFPVWYTPNITLFFASGQMSVIDHNSHLANIKLYPNPADELLNIATDKDVNILDVKITNVMGQVVHQNTVEQNQAEINVSHLRTGWYLVMINTTQGLVSKKLIID